MSVSKIEINPDDTEGLFPLLTQAFAYMEGRIDPPSSLTSMTRSDVARKALDEDLFVIRDGARIVACLFGQADPLPGADAAVYEVGKLAVAATHQSQGLARALMEAAADHARASGFTTLQLYARVQLVENHAIYAKMGFTQTGTFTHDGYPQPTALVFQRPL